MALRHEIDQDAEELIGIGVDLEAGRHLVLPGDHGVADQAEHVGDIVDQPVEGDQPAGRRGLAGAAVGERRLAIGDGAVEGADQLRREALDVGIGQAAEAIGEKLRRGQHVAEVVVDLGDGEAEIGEVALLAERALQVALHGGEVLLGDADLVACARSASMTRPVSSGASEKATMFAVSRRIGRTSRRLMVK